MKDFRTAGIALILIFWTGCASLRNQAQRGTSAGTPAKQSWESVAFIPVVSSVTVDLTTGKTITGKFRAADERELVLEQDGLLRRLPRTEVRRVILYQGRHTGRGTLWGLGIGAGALVGTLVLKRAVIYEVP